MRKSRTSRNTAALAVLTISLLFAGCGGGGSSSKPSSESNPDPNSSVTFTYALDSNQINSLPSGADHIDVILDGKETNFEVTARIIVYAEADSSEIGAQTLTFYVDPGVHTFTVTAMQGTTKIAEIKNITFTKRENIPATIPLAFDFPSFDKYATNAGSDDGETMISNGTDGKDRIVQYGEAENDLLSADTGADQDWAEQYGGDGDDTMVADTGAGNDYTYQEGGSGNNGMFATSGMGNDWVFQKGSNGNDSLHCVTGDDDDHIHQDGSAGNDMIRVTSGSGDDLANIDAGSGNDSITYDVGPGTDTAVIDGGDGNDLLTVNENGEANYSIKDGSSTIFSKGSDGTIITVTDIEGIRVVDGNGTTLFTRGTPPSPAAPSLPGVPDAGGFDNPVNVPAVTGDIAQLVNGTAGRDLITLYGGTGNVKQLVTGNAGDDWILQVTGGTTCQQSAYAGDGNDTVYQLITESGSATQAIKGGVTGTQTFIQIGGRGMNIMTADDSDNSGSALISQYGGPAGNTMEAAGSKGDDLISMYGGAGSDTLSYDMTAGADAVMTNGDAGENTLTVNTQGEADYTLKDCSGNILYTSGTGGTVITILNVQHITVFDENGDTVWSAE